MPLHVQLSRYRKDRLGSKIHLNPHTAITLLPRTTVLVVEGQSGAHAPGPCAGPPSASTCYPTLNTNEQCFSQGFARLQEVDSLSGTITGESGSGLGPTLTATGARCATRSRPSAAAAPD